MVTFSTASQRHVHDPRGGVSDQPEPLELITWYQAVTHRRPVRCGIGWNRTVGAIRRSDHPNCLAPGEDLALLGAGASGTVPIGGPSFDQKLA
jgi:hypothetical protein